MADENNCTLLALGGLSGNSSGKLAPGSFTYFITGWLFPACSIILVLLSIANYFHCTFNILSLAALDAVVVNVVTLERGVITEHSPVLRGKFCVIPSHTIAML